MVLLVIDMQKGIVSNGLYNYDKFLENIIKIVNAARDNNIQIVYFKHDAGLNSGLSQGDSDFEIIDEINPKPNDLLFIKTINSCFGNKEFKEYLKKQNDRRLMIVGLQTNYCIDATIKSAFERGYEIIIPKGTNSTYDNKFMSGKTTYNYYHEDVWEGLVNIITMKKAIDLLKRKE